MLIGNLRWSVCYHLYKLYRLANCIWNLKERDLLEDLTFFEPYIVIYICKKNQQNAHFVIHDLIQIYCLRHVSQNQVSILRKTCSSFMVFFSYIRVRSLVNVRMGLTLLEDNGIDEKIIHGEMDSFGSAVEPVVYSCQYGHSRQLILQYHKRRDIA